MVFAERLAAGYGDGDALVTSWCEELKSPNRAALPGRALACWDHRGRVRRDRGSRAVRTLGLWSGGIPGRQSGRPTFTGPGGWYAFAAVGAKQRYGKGAADGVAQVAADLVDAHRAASLG
jgi:hypothetical protein